MNAAKTRQGAKAPGLTLGILVATFVASYLVPAASQAQSFETLQIVNTTNNDSSDANPGDFVCDADPLTAGDQCSLRAAIEEANAGAERSNIDFDIPGGGLKTISPTSPLPPITNPLTIDGYTQRGSRPNTLATGTNVVLNVRLDGSSAGSMADGLDINASDVVVRGLVIDRFRLSGIDISSGTGNQVKGNYIGTDVQGQVGNNAGVRISGSNNTIGGTTAGARNVISGNADGIYTTTGAAGNMILGNYIGTSASGKVARGNLREGVTIFGGSSNTVGGTTSGERNVISGNRGGVRIVGSSNTGNTVTGNYIGTDASGTKDLGNLWFGVQVEGSKNSTIGGTTAEARNVISGNGLDGVEILDLGQPNTGNLVLANSIYANDGLGIDLKGGTENSAGATANDPQDADTGPNDLQNKPILTSATRTSSGRLRVTGTLNSTPNGTFALRFFSNPPGENEGKTFLALRSVATDPLGNDSFTFTLPQSVAVGKWITATATDADDNTSEFSGARRVTP